MSFLPFLIAAFSVSNTALWPANLDISNRLLTSPPLQYPPPPGSLSLNLPASDNELSSLILNPQKPSLNGAGVGGESSTVTLSSTYAETQTHPDGFNGICNSDISTGQKRRKRKSNYCRNREVVEFHPGVLKQQQSGETEEEEMNDDMAERASQWLADEFAFIYGPDWRETSDELKIQHGFIMMNQPQDDICIKQSATQGAPHVCPHAFCCLGPTETAPS